MKVREYDELSTKMQEKKATLSDLIIKKDELSGRLKASESIVSNQSFMYSVLVAINSSVPQGVSFSEINYTGDKTLIITGLSFSHLNISNFVDKLSSTKVISKSELLNMAEKTVNKRVFKSFSIKCTLANQQPVDKKEKSNGN
jgi:Tfp pilus assembly protein PilN